MNKKELEKKYEKIRDKQSGDENCRDSCEDMYPIESALLAVALDYVPAKVLKRIIENNKT